MNPFFSRRRRGTALISQKTLTIDSVDLNCHDHKTNPSHKVDLARRTYYFFRKHVRSLVFLLGSILLSSSLFIAFSPKLITVDKFVNAEIVSKENPDEGSIRKHNFPPRVAYLHTKYLHPESTAELRSIQINPAIYTDMTQYFPEMDSSDEEHREIFQKQQKRQPPKEQECVTYAGWQLESFPTCNMFHELDISTGILNFLSESTENDLYTPKIYPRSKGGGHDVWKVTVTDHFGTLNFVLKTLRWKRNFIEKEWDYTRIDSLAADRLTSSPYITDIFGYCAFSVWNDFAEGGTMDHFKSKSFSSLQKLEYAVQIAHAFWDLQRIGCSPESKNCHAPAIVHNDIGPTNFLLFDGKLKLNDFNMGILMYKNSTSGDSCTFQNGYICGENGQRLDVRSPEECSDHVLDEKIDVFGMGSALFFLLTGNRPYRISDAEKILKEEEKRDKIVRGEPPYLPDNIRNTEDFIIRGLKKVMEICWIFERERRPGVLEVKQKLDNLAKIQKD